MNRSVGSVLVIVLLLFSSHQIVAQCFPADIMEPGFKFLTSSRGCAPFTVQMQTEYLASEAGTIYYIDWGDGTPEETYVQTSPTGVILTHTYPNSPVDCGYDVIIDASNTCNPRGSVTPIETQVIVWTNDVISINPQVFRVCQGFAQELQFTDDSDWNCFPRATRENNEARWIQWIYGTGNGANRIPNITVDGVTGTYPYNDPDPLANPIYPVNAPGEVTLPIQVPVTVPADIGREFEITLKNWNQCNPYDLDLEDGDGRNPVSGDLVNGDMPPVVTTARIVIVDSPQPDFQTRAESLTGPIRNTFCIDEDIYFEDLTPGIAGANFQYDWEFYDNDSGTGSPIATSNDQNPIYSFSNAGIKLVRIYVRDGNAAGNCEAVFERQIFISPLLQASVGTNDINDNPIVPEFCQAPDESEVFTVRFTDESFGTVTPDIRWRWEFFDESGNLVREEPAGGSYSNAQLGPFDIDFQSRGNYLTRLTILDDATGCLSSDTAWVKVRIKPTPDFTFNSVCAGDSTTITDISTPPTGQAIVNYNYDIFNDGSIDYSFTNSEEFKVLFPSAGVFPVALTVESDQGCIETIVKDVNVEGLPEADITADKLSGCSVLDINFENLSWGQTQEIDYYEWEIDDGSGFIADSTQSPSDTTLNGFYTRSFVNTGTTDIFYDIRMIAYGTNGCITESNTLQVTVTPGATAGFLYTNYSPFNTNCSPQEVNFKADNGTQSLNPSDYQWEILLTDSIIFSQSTNNQPEFNYNFINSSDSIQDYEVRLTTTLPTNCFSDSTLTVRINPIPNAEFIIDTLFYACDQVILEFSSIQKGLPYYDWDMEIEGAPVFTQQGSDDSFTYTFDRINEDVDVNVSLSTRNLTNCNSPQASKSTTIPALNDIVASFSLSATELVLPDSTISITNLSSPGDLGYEWDFGNDSISTDQNPGEVYYNVPGDYVISLLVKDGDCMSSFSQVISVLAPSPTADFTFNTIVACDTVKVEFKSETTNAASYFWEFGDGETSDLSNPTHVYAEEGIYTVSLTVKGQFGEVVKEVKTNIIESVKPGATAGFIYSNYSPFNINCSPQEISFAVDNNTQALNPSGYQWDILLEDSVLYSEVSGTRPNFSYNFINTTDAILDYDVRLTTTLQSDCFSDSTLTVRINPIPRADFTIDTLLFACDQVTLEFASVQKGLPFYDWEMQVEGVPVYNQQGSGDSFSYTFDRTSQNTNVQVSLSTRNATNCSSEEVIKSAKVPAFVEVMASFSLSATDLELPDSTITITNTSSSGNLEYEWDFGNGTTSSERDPGEVYYGVQGEYVISLLIKDGDCKSSFSQAVKVIAPPPTVDFTYDPPVGCHPLKVSFKSVTANASSFFWEFGDGETSDLENPVHVYLDPGIYSVALTVKGDNGDVVKEVKSNIIEVVETPFAYFEIQPSIVYIPDNPIFTKNLSVSATSYYWDFGDGTVSNEFEPKHNYTRKGIFTVTLKAYNDYCYDSVSVEGAVSAKSSGRVLIPNAFSPNLSGPGGIGSGENDVFMPLLAEVREYRLQIFNRWGEILYEGINGGWDGYFNGQPCPQDVYVYKLYITFNNGDELTKVGDVNLIR